MSSWRLSLCLHAACLLACLFTFSTRANGAGREGTLRTTNAAGRSGAYYLPASAAGRAAPLVLAYHGTGGSGQIMVRALKPFADAHGFIIVAPDSRRSPSGEFTWEVGDRANDLSPDYHHAIACLQEVQQLSGVKVDTRRMLVLGHSGGASSAPYLASNYGAFEAFAVLHGGVYAAGFGTHKPRGWFSTGARDVMRSPQAVRAAMDQARARGLPKVTYFEAAGGHELGDDELRALMKWWLAPG